MQHDSDRKSADPTVTALAQDESCLSVQAEQLTQQAATLKTDVAGQAMNP
jgi:hypothetical protein